MYWNIYPSRPLFLASNNFSSVYSALCNLPPVDSSQNQCLIHNIRWSMHLSHVGLSRLFKCRKMSNNYVWFNLLIILPLCSQTLFLYIDTAKNRSIICTTCYNNIRHTNVSSQCLFTNYPRTGLIINKVITTDVDLQT